MTVPKQYTIIPERYQYLQLSVDAASRQGRAAATASAAAAAGATAFAAGTAVYPNG